MFHIRFKKHFWIFQYTGRTFHAIGIAVADLKLKLAKSQEAVEHSLCRRVRELRKKKKWTLEELSAASGVSRSMLSEIERGNANPTLAVACRIARAFDL